MRVGTKLRTAAGRWAKQNLGRRFPHTIGPGRYQRIVDQYEVHDLITNEDGQVPLRWWPVAPNFGDAISPWLVARMTGREVDSADPEQPHYIAVGSVLRRVTDQSIVWGTGSFGTEPKEQVNRRARYHAVRGPLTRARAMHHGAKVPAVYGDPALLAPLYYLPEVKITHDIGLVVRWNDNAWKSLEPGPGVRVIDLKTNDVESVIDAMLSCRRIVTSSLHGLIVADAYGIPNAWISSDTPKGGEFKYHDYFASVGKHRAPHEVDLQPGDLTATGLDSLVEYDARPIAFDYYRLLDACPFLRRRR